MAASLPIPVFTNLNDLYQNLATTLNHASSKQGSGDLQSTSHEHQAVSSNRTLFSSSSLTSRYILELCTSSLIGEHIDNALSRVFPAAIERDILIACASRPGRPLHSCTRQYHR
ncbi:hypothetical protein SERLADRAFT_437844 [Serpula lacrymans var. lacrymans S7.9]|uniref:Galactokinase N-terminal domain-containing protein n=1 Tax=Serpula lacrymans var. lacrymans (strain S7.9) TaxID=578457 RepID=F8NVS2_SERL9|nr:uncharacterized protein SERLADRAFT_437844 [Serpula lacrymans var. lacrymans S7.9]EGO24233.1 hypothetical protein SERLADRAFT_437844 [Serpula lacrymans var. lacrymans S7.9]